jgi:hypothetical protein
MENHECQVGGGISTNNCDPRVGHLHYDSMLPKSTAAKTMHLKRSFSLSAITFKNCAIRRLPLRSTASTKRLSPCMKALAISSRGASAEPCSPRGSTSTNCLLASPPKNSQRSTCTHSLDQNARVKDSVLASLVVGKLLAAAPFRWSSALLHLPSMARFLCIFCLSALLLTEGWMLISPRLFPFHLYTTIGMVSGYTPSLDKLSCSAYTMYQILFVTQYKGDT